MSMDLNRVKKLAKRAIFVLGVLGVVVIYSGFLYLTFTGRDAVNISWYMLLSPWICIYVGLSSTQQTQVVIWLLRKFGR